MSVERVTFPGFVPVRQADTETHEVEIGRITQGDAVFIVHMIRRRKLPFEADFLVAKVLDASEQVCYWRFQDENFSGVGVLARADEEIVIALVGKGRAGMVEKIVPFSTIDSSYPMDIRRRIALKREAAEYLGRDFWLTQNESKVAKRDADLLKEAHRRAAEEKREARERARSELRAKIPQRGQVTAYTSDGRKRYGFPVTDHEWPSLSKGTNVVLVEDYDETTGDMGAAREAFQIVKERGKNPKKGDRTAVSWENPVSEDVTSKDVPEPVGEAVIETDAGEVFEVAVYATMEDVRTARASGLNSGAHVTAEDKRHPDGRFEVFSVHAEGVDTLGLFAPID